MEKKGRGLWLFHRIVYRILWGPVWLFTVLFLHHRPARPPRIKGPCLIVANHNTDYDLMLVAASFHRHMYFVGSEHIWRWGFASKLLQFFFAPIARVKGSTDGAAAMAMLRQLRAGRNVCVFAEGNRSFAGITTPIHPTIGRLAKMSGANLVVYRIEGGYFTQPRWGTTVRRGSLRTVLARVYTPDELRAMSRREINDAISSQIREDAYALQDRNHARYLGRRLAEGIETALFLCPGCGGIQTLKSRDDEFRCQRCGLLGRYTEYGYLEGAGVPFRTIAEWDAWQDGELRRIVENNVSGELFSDGGETLSEVLPDHTVRTAAEGVVSISRTEFRVGETRFSLEEITDMAMFGRQNLAFTVGDRNYESRSDHFRSARKYLHAYGILRGKPLGV